MHLKMYKPLHTAMLSLMALLKIMFQFAEVRKKDPSLKMHVELILANITWLYLTKFNCFLCYYQVRLANIIG